MSSYCGISRAFRPQTFADILGQDALVTTLKNALRAKKTAHAYLFCGTRGTGKTTIARVLAKALNCKNLSKDTEPCNACDSCQEIIQGKNLNVFEIDGASNRGIDDIRALSEGLGYGALAQGCKIFIIDEVHMLTKEAFNALLKTLEEPPPNVKFFLATTEPHKIPATVLSRCQRFDLRRISTGKIVQKLSQIAKVQSLSCEDEALHQIALRSDGSMRVAESLLDQALCFSEGVLTEKTISESLAILPQETFFKIDEAFRQKDLRFAFTLSQEIFSSGKDLSYFFECLLEHYQTIFSMKLSLPLEDLLPTQRARYQNSAEIYTEEQLLYILDYLMHWHEEASKTPFKRVMLEMVLLHIIRSKHKVSVADLVAHIKSLQEGLPPPSNTLSKPPAKEDLIGILQNNLKPEKEPSSAQLPSKAPIQEDPVGILQSNLKSEKEPSSTQLAPKKDPIKALPVDSKPVKEPPVKEEAFQPTKSFQIKSDTLMRFASVELEGTLTKE
jgi:DNA polymerase III subunit gamma/tau